jgi:tRNA A-37 threonylcarbamoyl transferase component Bud32
MAQAGRYTLLDEIGSGGMGAVYRAEDRANRRVVAFKQLRSTVAGPKRRMFEALFEREYHTLVRLKHPRIIEVFDYGLSEQGPYYTMELLGGLDLQQLAPLPFREACRHLRDVASSLALIHAHRLVHRDVSARNVRLTADGRAKLIDFGALATFGIANEVAGTPPYMAPEVLRRLALDQRTDLFALGATGYWALTGHHAFPARKVQDLPIVWQNPPPPPSQIVSGIPPALDALIMSLLSVEPLARPANAAAVIDQLTAIAGLNPEEHDQAGESYLSSGRLVGRELERAWLHERITRALDGKITEVVIEGASGIGKTRLMHEVSLDAQLKGAVALRADAQSTSQAFEVAASLAVQLLALCPEIARRALGEHGPLLAHLSPELASALDCAVMAQLSEDPPERRARFQTALHDWFFAVVTAQPLLIAVDNAQSADDNSAAFLAALGQETRSAKLMLLITQTAGDDVVAKVPLRVMRKRAARLKLAGLDARACEELVSSLFGNVANTGRLARVLYDKSAGNPQLCMDLAQLLVKRKIVKYVDGSWVLPLELAHDELPSRVEELMRERLAALGPDARQLCESLSIHSKRVPIERCLTLAGEMGEQRAYLALDELVADQILLAEGGNYGFRQQALRQSVLAQIDEARRRALHQRAAQALLVSAEPEVGVRMDAAWHLLHAGEDLRAADLMAGAARDFLRHQGVESVEDVVHALDTALLLYEKHKRSKYEIASLLFPLMSLAFFVDWRITLKHGERAIRLGLDITGLGLAQRLSRYLPGMLALGVGLCVAAVRFVPQQLRGLKFNLIEAIETFCGLVPAATGTQNIVFDLPATKRFVHLLEPLKLFGKGHIASMMYDFADTQYLMSHAREADATDLLEQLRRDLPAPAIKKTLGEAYWKAMYGGVLFSLGILYPYEFGTRTLDIAREMEELGVRVWAMAAEEVRMLYHALRGESEAVQRCRERVELFAVQGSTTWQADIFWPILLMDSEIRAADPIAVRTIREQVSRRAKDHASLQPYADVAHATYLTLRGQHSAAIAAFERLSERLRIQDPALRWPVYRACFAYAEALNIVGEHVRAKRYASESLALAGKDVGRVVAHYLEPQRQLALAEAGLGNHAEAVRMLDGLLAAYGAQDQPLLIGLLHKARAEVALLMNDGDAFATHFAQMEHRFRSSRNPALIAQIERTAKRARKAVPGEGSSIPAATPVRADMVSAVHAISGISDAADRAAFALRLILERTLAKSGFLYLLDGERLELAAASADAAPVSQLAGLLERDLQQARLRALEDDEQMTAVSAPPGATAVDNVKSLFIDSTPTAAPDVAAECEQAYRLLVLRTQRDGGMVIGGLIVEIEPKLAAALDLDMLEPIACALRAGACSAAPTKLE